MEEFSVSSLHSPNYSSRRGSIVDCIILHHTGTLVFQKTVKMFTSGESKVSAHYVIARNPEEGIVNFVPSSEKAWHCGRAAMWKVPDVNLFSVGVQLVGTADSGFTPFQYQASAFVCANIMNQYPGIFFNRIIGHDAIAERMNGPGPLWQWGRFFDILVSRLYGLSLERE